MDTLEIGRRMVGEVLHVLSLDHLSPRQAHWTTEDDDGCADTPWTSMYNRLDCDNEDIRCALTQCQIGRMHATFETLKPAFERFPDGSGGFSDSLNLCDITLSDIIIPDGADLVWRGPRKLRSNVIIKAGGRLTLKCDVGMPNDAKFIVESGGKLIVDGARIYNNCDNSYWHGIQVNGTNQAQFPLSNQAYLGFTAGSVLENAAFPITANGGSFVIANNTDFNNCGRIIFFDYALNNSSQFNNCDFDRDASFENFGSWPNQIELNSVKGIKISGSNFNTINPAATTNNGIAIQAFSSIFTVDNSSFNNFRVGIWGYSWFDNPVGKFTVKNSTFSNNRIGVASWANNNIVIQNNAFTGIGTHPEAGSHRGLTLRNCTGYTVQGNQFNGISSSNTNLIGVWAVNTGAELNVIIGNNFDSLYVANQAEGNNTGNDALDGLQYHCNINNTENNFDFLVFDEGISEFQGSEQAGTKNEFSHFNASLGDFNNQSFTSINYYHTNTQVETPLPGYYFNIFPVFAPQGIDCPTSGEDEDGKLSAQEEQALIQIFNTADTDRAPLLTSYKGLLNGGEIESNLVSEIMSATSLDVPTLKQDLLSASPYLTQAVLEAVAERDDIFSNNDLDAILSANPDEIRSPELQGILYAKLDQNLVQGILVNQNQVTSRTTMEADLANYQRMMHQAANRILKSEIADTNGLDLSMYRLWLSNKESREAEYELVGTYIMEEDYTTANQLRDAMSTKFNLQNEDLTEHTYYTDLSNIIISAQQSSTHYAALDPSTVSQIETIANNSLGLAGTMAQGLLNVFYGYNYELIPKVPGGGSALARKPLEEPNNHFNVGQSLEAIPNPAKDLVNFHYLLEESIHSASLQIYNVNGVLVETLTLEGKEGNIIWNTSKHKRGIYFCRIEHNGKLSHPIKLVLM